MTVKARLASLHIVRFGQLVVGHLIDEAEEVLVDGVATTLV